MEINWETLEIKNSEVANLALRLSEKIEERPEMVVFVATGAFSLGQALARLYNIPVCEIKAARSGNSLKAMLTPFLKILPKRLKLWLRKKEQSSGYHSTNSSREILFNPPEMDMHIKSILLIDDAVDTGYTILACRREIEKQYPQASVKVAALTVFDMSKERIRVDYSLYENVILMGPWSNDSKEHAQFVREYQLAKKNGEF